MRNGLGESQAGIKIVGRNINNLRYADDTTLMAESEEELKSFLMRVKSWLKTQHSENSSLGDSIPSSSPRAIKCKMRTVRGVCDLSEYQEICILVYIFKNISSN